MDDTAPIFKRLMAWENDTLDFNESVELFAELIRTGLASTLTGPVSRQARDFIDAGLIDHSGVIQRAELDGQLREMDDRAS